MIETAFTRLVGCAAPVQLAPMPAISTPELAAAVADAGGLGMIGAPLLTAEQLGAQIDGLKKATEGVFGVNFLIPFLDRACLDAAAERAPVIEFFYGDPDPGLVSAARRHGALAGWQVGSRDEAASAVRCGCDFVVAQGTEAGGHVRGRTSLLPLLSEVLAAVDVPVLAAGGIATPRDLAAVIACGAAGARVGTRFLASAESGAHPDYVSAVVAAEAEDTCLTEAFSVMWPDAPHRVLCSAIRAAESLSDDFVAELQLGGQTLPVPRFGVMAPNRGATGHIEAMALYAGESVANIHDVRPAADILRELVDGAEQLLDRRR